MLVITSLLNWSAKIALVQFSAQDELSYEYSIHFALVCITQPRLGSLHTTLLKRNTRASCMALPMHAQSGLQFNIPIMDALQTMQALYRKPESFVWKSPQILALFNTFTHHAGIPRRKYSIMTEEMLDKRTEESQ